ncbi:MAG: SDR family oxidoreductase [Candidatus Omnitrophica bacterium]|nr:SDR family oxidoreductase [Candidatus Omnitrophota bacterium]
MSAIPLNFKGKVALVTGGARGIGRAIVKRLHYCGAKVIYTGTSTGKTHAVKGCMYWPLDLSKEQSVAEFTGRMRTLKRLDILVNNAGINIIEAIDQVEKSHWDRVLQVNLTGAMLLMKEAAILMKKNKRGGKILNISSIFGIVSRAKRNAYSASKAGLIGLTRAAALDLATDGILVNALCPGFVKTDLTASILSEQEMRLLSAKVPLGRFAQEEEVATAALFACSDFNLYMTGQAIVVDGGYTLR